MILDIGQLVTVYVILTAILAGLCIFSTLSWGSKAMLIFLASSSYLIAYYSFAPLQGWPTSSNLPMRFNLVAVYAQEPDAHTGREGEFFLGHGQNEWRHHPSRS
jgi:hypothetical protein